MDGIIPQNIELYIENNYDKLIEVPTQTNKDQKWKKILLILLICLLILILMIIVLYYSIHNYNINKDKYKLDDSN